MDSKKSIVRVYNTITGIYEEIEVSETIASILNKYDRKERYLTEDLKVEQPIKKKDGTTFYRPSREISLNLIEDESEIEFAAFYDLQEVATLHIDLEKAFHQLTTEEKEIVQLLYYQDKTQKSVSKKMCVTQQMINKRNKKILKKLKFFLENGC